MPLAEGRGKRHASHAPVSLPLKVSRSVPASARSPGDDETIFSQSVVTPDARGLGTERAGKEIAAGAGRVFGCAVR